jgi:hypothetical protein
MEPSRVHPGYGFIFHAHVKLSRRLAVPKQARCSERRPGVTESIRRPPMHGSRRMMPADPQAPR